MVIKPLTTCTDKHTTYHDHIQCGTPSLPSPQLHCGSWCHRQWKWAYGNDASLSCDPSDHPKQLDRRKQRRTKRERIKVHNGGRLRTTIHTWVQCKVSQLGQFCIRTLKFVKSDTSPHSVHNTFWLFENLLLHEVVKVTCNGGRRKSGNDGAVMMSQTAQRMYAEGQMILYCFRPTEPTPVMQRLSLCIHMVEQSNLWPGAQICATAMHLPMFHCDLCG